MEREPKVDKYIANTPAPFQALLSDLRDRVIAYFPEGEETFAYNIPVYKYQGKAIFSIAAFKNHYSIVTQDKDIAVKIPVFAKQKISGTTVHFTASDIIADDLLRKFIKQRISERTKV